MLHPVVGWRGASPAVCLGLTVGDGEQAG